MNFLMVSGKLSDRVVNLLLSTKSSKWSKDMYIISWRRKQIKRVIETWKLNGLFPFRINTLS